MKNKYIKGAHFSQRKFRELLKLFCEDISALTASKLLELSVKTVQRINTLLRERILSLASEENHSFAGEVEVDESYFGAKRVRGVSGKTPVIELLKRNGKVFVQVVNNCSRKELVPIIKGQLLEETTVYTDGWKVYDSLVREGYKHHRVHHHKDEFSRGKTHVNGIEIFWSYVKFRTTKLRGVKKDKFVMRLMESDWRYTS